MVCFCKESASSLAQTLPSLSVSASESLSFSLAAADQVSALARLLMSRGLPATQWNPDPSWLQLELPAAPLNANAMATLTAFAQLQATAAPMGMNLTTAPGARAFAELSASIAARVSVLATMPIPVNAAPYAQLAATLQACAQVAAALSMNTNLLASLSASASAANASSAGLPASALSNASPNTNMSLWAGFVAQMRALLPVLPLVAQLNLSGDISAQLSQALKAMLSIPMPQMPIASLTLMSSLTSTLAAMAQIRQTLGVDPLSVGLPTLKAMVEDKIQATIRMVESLLGMPLSAVPQLLAPLQVCPALVATPTNVSLAASLNFPPINWNIPPIGSLPILSTGLPIAAFVTQLRAALGLNMALSPCMAGCDMQ